MTKYLLIILLKQSGQQPPLVRGNTSEPACSLIGIPCAVYFRHGRQHNMLVVVHNVVAPTPGAKFQSVPFLFPFSRDQKGCRQHPKFSHTRVTPAGNEPVDTAQLVGPFVAISSTLYAVPTVPFASAPVVRVVHVPRRGNGFCVKF